MPLDPAKLSVIHYPDPRLRARSKEISKITDEVVTVARRMLQLMHEAPGVGLAAPQVGLNLRMFVASHTGKEEDDKVFINPVITPIGKTLVEMDEGCLSLPEIDISVLRPVEVKIEATGLDGQTFTLTSNELAARIWQHELDHLDGVLIIDRATPMDRLACRKKLRELEEEFSST